MCSISTATALAAVAFLSAAAPAHAYVDLAPTLATVVNSSQAIAVAEVDRFSLEKGVVVLKKVRDLKGEVGTDPIRQRVIGLQESSVDRIVLDWAEPGARCVLFASGKTTLVCVGRGWYQVHAAGDDWQQLGAPRPDLPLAYYGSVSRLSDALARMLAGKTAVITTLQHGAADREAASFDLALNRAAVPSLVKVERIRASLHMPGVVMAVSANPAYKVGLGQAGEEEIPDLKKKLRDADATVRAESAADLGSLGPRAADAADDLAKLLDDGAPAVRTAAAAALSAYQPPRGAGGRRAGPGIGERGLRGAPAGGAGRRPGGCRGRPARRQARRAPDRRRRAERAGPRWAPSPPSARPPPGRSTRSSPCWTGRKPPSTLRTPWAASGRPPVPP